MTVDECDKALWSRVGYCPETHPTDRNNRLTSSTVNRFSSVYAIAIASLLSEQCGNLVHPGKRIIIPADLKDKLTFKTIRPHDIMIPKHKIGRAHV